METLERQRCFGRRIARTLFGLRCSPGGVYAYLVDEIGLSEVDAAAIVRDERV